MTLTFSPEQMINSSSGEARDKATRADGRGRWRWGGDTSFTPASGADPLVYQLYKRHVRGDEISFCLCVSVSHSSPATYRHFGEKTCHTTLSLSSKDRLFCRATVLCDKRLIFIQPPPPLFSFCDFFLCDKSRCLFCRLLPSALSEKFGTLRHASMQIVGGAAPVVFELQRKHIKAKG